MLEDNKHVRLRGLRVFSWALPLAWFVDIAVARLELDSAWVYVGADVVRAGAGVAMAVGLWWAGGSIAVRKRFRVAALLWLVQAIFIGAQWAGASFLSSGLALLVWILFGVTVAAMAMTVAAMIKEADWRTRWWARGAVLALVLYLGDVWLMLSATLMTFFVDHPSLAVGLELGAALLWVVSLLLLARAISERIANE